MMGEIQWPCDGISPNLGTLECLKASKRAKGGEKVEESI
jgi:hypothetical protein